MRLLTLNWFAALFAVAFCSTLACADDRDFSATVGRIFDGDSFLVRPAKGRDIDVRLQDIDAPEKDQPYGPAARAALVKLIGARRVFVDVIENDRYGRKVVKVFREPDRLDIVKALVRDGHVWVYRRTVHDRSLIALEEAARAGNRGIWALAPADRVPPWQHRNYQRQHRRKSTPASLERAEPGRFHQAITQIATAVLIAPGAERGGEIGAGWPIVVPQTIEVADHLHAER